MGPRTTTTSTPDLNVVFLPGLGADGRLFAAQREVFPNLISPPWLAPAGHEDLAQYAARLAEKVPLGRPLFLGGCSLGGMLAYEMARLLRPDALVLMGSASSRHEIPAYLRLLAGLARIVPLAGFRLARLAPPAVGHLFGVHDIEQRWILIDMFRRTSPEFFRWACAAIHEWNPQPLAAVPVFVIHGAHDRILPLGRRAVDVVIKGAGHLLTMTHHQQVNEFLYKIKEGLTDTTKAVAAS